MSQTATGSGPPALVDEVHRDKPAEPVGVLRSDHEMGDRPSDRVNDHAARTCPQAPSLQLASAPITNRAVSAMAILSLRP